MAQAGAFVSIDYDGNLNIERGFVRPADEPPLPEPMGIDDAAVPGGFGDGDGGAACCAPSTADTAVSQVADPEDDEPDDGGRLPERLMTELTAHRTVALRAALSSDPDAALLALIHALALRSFYGSAAETCLETEAKSIGLAPFAPGANDAVASRTLAQRHGHWQTQLPRHPRDLWPVLVALDADSRAALLAVCVGRSVNAVGQPWNRRAGAIAHADRLAAHVGLDMGVDCGWAPTVDGYLGRVTKARTLAALREARGEAAAERIASIRKAQMAEAAEVLLAGTGWLPVPLRTPEPVRPVTETAADAEHSEALAASPADVDGPASDHDPRRRPIRPAARHRGRVIPTHRAASAARHRRELAPCRRSGVRAGPFASLEIVMSPAELSFLPVRHVLTAVTAAHVVPRPMGGMRFELLSEPGEDQRHG